MVDNKSDPALAHESKRDDKPNQDHFHYHKRSNSFAIHSSNTTSSPVPPRSISLSAQGGAPGPKRRQSGYNGNGTSIEEITPRRLGRKLPPELTESLLALEEQHQESRSDMDSFDSRSSTVTIRLGTGHVSPEYPSIKSSPNPSIDLSNSNTNTSDGQTLVHHDFAKYTLNVDPPLDQVLAWAKQLSPSSPGPVPARPARSIHRIRQHSLTPSDSPSSATSSATDPITPISPNFPGSQFRNNWPSRRNLSPMPHGSGSGSVIAIASGSRPLPPLPVSQPPQDAPSLTTCSTASTSCWSAFEDFETAHPRGPGGKESRKQKKERKRQEAQVFSADEPPELKDLFQASRCEVIDESGVRMPFRELVSGKKTIVIFIRHWYCPLCAQYMNSIIANVTPRVLEDAGMDLIVIGNGSYKMLDGYRNKHFKFPFKMYTDPSLALYRALGLTRQTGDAGADSDAGSYLIQTPLESTVQTIKRATKMPLRSPGHFLQLGGEFVFDGSLNLTYTHRMTTTRDHSPIETVCEAAGLELAFVHYEPGPRPPPVHRGSMEGDLDDWAWKAEREGTLAEMRMKKERRRAGIVDIQEGSEDEGFSNGVDIEDPELRELVVRIERF